MLSTLLAIGWEPEIRGALTVIIGVVALMGSVYLILGTNMGARLGLLVALAGLFGWMATMGAIWWTYGIGLKGREPTWKPAAPISIVRDARLLDRAEVIGAPIKIDSGATPTDVAKAAQAELVAAGWTRLDDADPRRGQAVASADDISRTRPRNTQQASTPRLRCTTAVVNVGRRSPTRSTSPRCCTSRVTRSSSSRRWCPNAPSPAAHPRVPSSTKSNRTVTCS